MNNDLEKKILIDRVGEIEKRIVSDYQYIFKLGKKHSYLDILDAIDFQIKHLPSMDLESRIALKSLKEYILEKIK